RETEGAREHLARHLAEIGPQRIFRERRFLGIDQGTQIASAATEVERIAQAVDDARSDPQVTQAMQKVLRGALRKSEQKVRDRRKRRALAGLVAPIEEMQARIFAEWDVAIRKRAVALEIEANEAHASNPSTGEAAEDERDRFVHEGVELIGELGRSVVGVG